MRAVLWIIIGLTVVPSAALAQTDEIQVYDAEIEPQGIFNLMVHSNFTPAGRTVPFFPGAIIADHSFNGTAEWAYGVTPWMEQGLYLPVYTIYSMNHATTINGFKIRELFALYAAGSMPKVSRRHETPSASTKAGRLCRRMRGGTRRA